MKIVKFKDGTYGIRKRVWLFWFKFMLNTGYEAFDFHYRSTFKTDAGYKFKTIEAVKEKYSKFVKQKNSSKPDVGEPVNRSGFINGWPIPPAPPMPTAKPPRKP